MAALHRVSTVDALQDALRAAILDGELPAGSRLREQALCDEYHVARHSLRAALRALAAEGLVRIEPNRGASVARLTNEDARALYELRTALEIEAAHLALERNGGHLPAPVHDALHRLERACASRRWSAITETHAGLHTAIVEASGSPRIVAAHAALSGEMRLFLLALKPHLPADDLAADHARLVRRLETEGPAVLRGHLREAAETFAGEGDRPGG
jgi:DNA-binding GntR family transcriptional regulator